MRKQQIAVIALLTLSSLMPAREAAAQRGSKGWLEKLSGPGPFSGWDFASPPIFCFGTDGSSRWFFEYGRGRQPICVDVEYGFFDNEEDDVFGEVNVKTFSVGAFYEFHRAVSLGGSIGFIRFSGDRFEAFSRTTIIPVRVIFKPLELGRPRERNREKWRSLLRLDFKEYYVPSRFTGADFGVPLAPLNEEREYLAYWSIGVDFSEYLKVRD